MKLDISTLPDDPQKLKSLLIHLEEEYRSNYQDLEEGYKANYRDLEKEYEARYQDLENRHKAMYQDLEEKYLTLQRKFFGRSSEKLSREEEDQLRLFNEAESGSADTDTSGIDPGTIVVKEHARKAGGRRKLPEDLPREEIIHDLSEEEKKCPCCRENRPCIGREVTEELDIVPARIKVVRHIRIKYGPCSCDGFIEQQHSEILTAPQPARMIPKSIVSPGLLSYVITSKYADSLPLYRQSKMFERIDIEMPRATLCNWVLLAAEKCKPLIDCMKKEIKSSPFIQMDETTVQVLREHGRDPTGSSYMWVMVGYPERNRPLILFEYHPGRSQAIPLKILEGYKGYLQTDGYGGYNRAGNLPDIVHVGCFAHARRYFHEALKLSKKSKTAHKGIAYIQKLYSIEHGLRKKDITADEFLRKRKEEASPVLAEFHAWLQEKNIYITPESKAGKAVRYALNEWNKLVRYLDAPFLTPDNNAVENAIRPFVVGRKNWLFSNTPRGAYASAVLYSLVESARANNLEPYQYLRYLFTKLPGCSSSDEMKVLLPAYVSKKDINSV